MVFETAHEFVDGLFVVIPIFFEGRNLDLSFRQLLVEFAQFFLLRPLLLVDWQGLLGDLCERLSDEIIEVLSLLHQHFLDVEEVPVFADRVQQIIEEVVKSFSKVVADFDDVRSQLNLVVFDAFCDKTSDWGLSALDVRNRRLDFALDRLVEIELVQ